MAASNFNTTVLKSMEQDALVAAILRLQLDKKSETVPVVDLIREANTVLPQARDGEAIRIFFSTRHQAQDDAFDNIKDLATFLTTTASRIQQLPENAKSEINETGETGETGEIDEVSENVQFPCDAVLYDLSEGYSYVLEATNNLLSRGMVAARRVAELKAMTLAPAAPNELDGGLFATASAIYAARLAGDDDIEGDGSPRPA